MGYRENLASLKAAYAAWNDRKGYSVDVWRELMGEPFYLGSVSSETVADLGFAKERHTKAEAIKYLTGIFDHWEMVHYTPQHYVGDDERIAMFGMCAYRNKRTGKVAECRIACLWRFENGKAVELIDVFDSAVAAAAAV